MLKTIKALHQRTTAWFHPRRALPADGVQVLTGEGWLDRVVAVHTQVRAEMPESQRHFLLPKPPAYFRDLLLGKTGALLGVMAQDDLVGILGVVKVESFAKAHAEGLITYPDDDGLLGDFCGVGAVAVAQSLCVLNASMGRGLLGHLVQGAVTWAGQEGCAHVFAQVADQNVMSWIRFMNQSFALLASWESGHGRFLLRWQTPIEKTASLHHAKGYHIYRKDYAQIPALLAELRGKVEQGFTVLLDNKADEAGALRFVFTKGFAS